MPPRHFRDSSGVGEGLGESILQPIVSVYQFKFTISPIKQPLRQFTFPNAPPIDYYEV